MTADTPELLEVAALTVEQVQRMRTAAAACARGAGAADVFDLAQLAAAGVTPEAVVALCDGWLIHELDRAFTTPDGEE